MTTENILSNEDLILLKSCKNDLENINFFMQVINIFGSKIESASKIVPEKLKDKIGKASNKALFSIIDANLLTMKKENQQSPKNFRYKATVAVSGAGFGFIGFAGFAADLTLTTKLIIRSVMDIARSKGEDIHDMETKLNCLSVFALGGKSKEDDGLNTSYYATRIALNSFIKNTTNQVSQYGLQAVINGLAAGTPLFGLVLRIASRYQMQALEKFVATGFPVIGAVGGASINVLFMQHFQKMAEAHFTLRQLERKYGKEEVQKCYEGLKV